jgi:hypothetical protein
VRAEDPDQLAAKLGRPVASLPALRGLTADQIGLLSDLIDAAGTRRRNALDEALAAAIPLLPGAVARRILQGRPG